MKKNVKLFALFLVFVILFALQSCLAQEAKPTQDMQKPQTAQTPQTQEEPINVSSKNFPIIDFVGIKILVPAGTMLGGNYFISPAEFGPPKQEIIKNFLLLELEKAGYNLSRPSALFGADESRKPRFLLAGGLSKWSAFYHQGFWSNADTFVDASVEVQWEIYDQIAKKVIYRATTEGYGATKGVSDLETPTIEAIRVSFKKLLCNKELVAALDGNVVASVPEKKIDCTVFYYRANKSMEDAPDKIAEAIKTVFTLKLPTSHGSGFLINSDGFALTNNHVVEGVTSFEAIFSDGKTIKGEVIKTIPERDLALVKLSGSGYQYLPLKLTRDLSIGQDIFAIGTPADISMGLSQTVSKGIISGMREKVKFTKEPQTLIQTDAAINKGNSGGPIIDSKGFAIGVSFSGLTTEKGFEGLKFAISIDEAILAFGLLEGQIAVPPPIIKKDGQK